MADELGDLLDRVYLDAAVDEDVVHEGDEYSVDHEFKYEKIMDFCYICWCLDYNDKDCDVELFLKSEIQSIDRGYGSHLRAETCNPARGTGSFLSTSAS